MRPRTFEEFIAIVPLHIQSRHDFASIFSALKEMYEIGASNGYEFGYECGYNAGETDAKENDR